MDPIFSNNSASFVYVTITSSLVSATGSNIDLSNSTEVSGSFKGKLIGSASYAETASVALNASFNVDGGSPNSVYGGLQQPAIYGGDP